MRKNILLLLLMALPLFGIQPVHSWHFTKVVNGQIPDGGTGTPKLPYKNIAYCRADAGLNCPDGGYTFIVFPQKKLDFAELTFDVCFRMTSPLDGKRRTIISYEHTAWRQCYVIMQFNDKDKLEVIVRERKKDQLVKEFILTAEKTEVAPVVWHSARVALASGGEGRLWLDGTLVASKKNALSISDLSYSPKQYYPLLTFGTDPGNPQEKSAFLRGSIAEVRMWNAIVEPNPLTDAPVTDEERDNSHALVSTQGIAPELTCRFNVLDFEGAAAGSTVTADAKFVRCAGRAAAELVGDALVVTYRCPIPEDVDPQIKPDGGVWSGDAVEFFFRPDKTQSLYYHYGA
ncbi:MAG: hypothetical protein J6X55_06180, partial [Victivallales bacterium]|nr:hypothetical protein [Victivallales bacterium]